MILKANQCNFYISICPLISVCLFPAREAGRYPTYIGRWFFHFLRNQGKSFALPEITGQVRTMCDVAQRLEDKGRSEGRIEGQIEVLVTLVKSGSITVDMAAGILKITTTEFKKYL